MTKEEFEERYMPEPNTGCFLWLGARNDQGYGQFRKNYLTHYAHRHAWALEHGPISDNLWVLHKCDTPSCVNPVHLFLGTQQDNMDDCAKKARTQHGDAHKQAKLTSEQVREIRQRAASGRHILDGERHTTLAAEFGVSKATISMIVHRRIWNRVS